MKKIISLTGLKSFYVVKDPRFARAFDCTLPTLATLVPDTIILSIHTSFVLALKSRWKFAFFEDYAANTFLLQF